jgi:hypothetical protein
MSLAKSVRGADKPEAPPPIPTGCIAHGCPLPGVYRLSNDSSICRAHDDQNPAMWGAITARVRNRIDSMMRALRLTNASPGDLPPRTDEAELVRLHGETYSVLKGGEFHHGCETARQYGARTFACLVRECVPATAQPEPPPRSEESMRKASELIERVSP